MPGLFVLNIEYRRHFIAIACLKAAIIKIDIARQFGIDKSQVFLLTTSHEIGSEYFKIVYVNKVFVVVTTTNSILTCQFVIRSYNYFDQTFDTASGGGNINGIFRVDHYESGFSSGTLIRYDHRRQFSGTFFHP